MFRTADISFLGRGILSAILLIGLAPAAAVAEDLTIQDTGGFTRAASQIDGNSKVEFDLIDSLGNAPDGVPVTLTNAATGEVLTASSSSGAASFQGVTPGVWTVSTTSAGVTFTNVTVASAIATGSSLGSSTLIPIIALGAGGAGIAIAVDNNRGSSGGDELSPSS